MNLRKRPVLPGGIDMKGVVSISTERLQWLNYSSTYQHYCAEQVRWLLKVHVWGCSSARGGGGACFAYASSRGWSSEDALVRPSLRKPGGLTLGTPTTVVLFSRIVAIGLPLNGCVEIACVLCVGGGAFFARAAFFAVGSCVASALCVGARAGVSRCIRKAELFSKSQ